MHPDFRHIDTWVFDLDHTLYPPTVKLFDQIEAKMVAFMRDFLNIDVETANQLRGTYWRTHGTTLAGLMANHDMPPYPFLDDVHDIDFTILPHAGVLADQISGLPGRKLIYTNGTAPYARQVLAARGLLDIFHDVYGVEHANFRPKPEQAAFETVFKKAGVVGPTAAMFEDDVRNLEVPKSMGMATVHIAPTPAPAEHIDHHSPVLEDMLSRILGDVC